MWYTIVQNRHVITGYVNVSIMYMDCLTFISDMVGNMKYAITDVLTIVKIYVRLRNA